MIKRLWDNEPNAIAGGFIVALAVLYEALKWAGIEVPDSLRTALQVAIGAWVVLLRTKMAPIDGVQNAEIKTVARAVAPIRGTGDGGSTPIDVKVTGTGDGGLPPGGPPPTSYGKRFPVLFLVLFLGFSACAKTPPDITPTQKLLSQANEAVLHLGAVQHVAIGLNKIERCEPGTNNVQACEPVLSTENTRKVVDAVDLGVSTISKLPSGWKAAATSALTSIQEQLDDYGLSKLKTWLDAAIAALGAL